MARQNGGGRGQAKGAKQMDQMVRTNFEFAQELGGKEYAPPGSASKPVSQKDQQTTVNPGQYGG